MKKQNTKLPKWFKGQLYDEGDTVKNPFSGEEDFQKGLDWFRQHNASAYMTLLD